MQDEMKNGNCKGDAGGSPSVAVVIPVYDSEATLGQCIASVVRQDCAGLEIVLVDDGSRDGSGILCDEWAAKDGRVTVVHQENRGRSAARAAGVEAARAQWVCFVDSDDMLPPGAVSRLLAAAAPDVDIVLGNGRLLGEHFRERIPMCDFRHLAVRGEGPIGVPWGSLFRRSLLSNDYVWNIPREIYMGEDYIFWLRVAFGTEKPVAVVYANVYDKGPDTTSSRFVWDAGYALAVDRLRREAIPAGEHEAYLADMVADRMVNLMAVALHQPAREWRSSCFYAEWLADVARAGFEVPRGARLYLSLPFRWMRKAYSRLSDVKQKVIGK